MNYLSDKIDNQSYQIVEDFGVKITTELKNGFVLTKMYHSDGEDPSSAFVNLCKEKELSRVAELYVFFEKEIRYQENLAKQDENGINVFCSLYYPPGKEPVTTHKEFSVYFGNDETVSRQMTKQQLVQKLVDEEIIGKDDIEFIKEIKIED